MTVSIEQLKNYGFAPSSYNVYVVYPSLAFSHSLYICVCGGGGGNIS
jgi:hypothetical protein